MVILMPSSLDSNIANLSQKNIQLEEHVKLVTAQELFNVWKNSFPKVCIIDSTENKTDTKEKIMEKDTYGVDKIKKLDKMDINTELIYVIEKKLNPYYESHKYDELIEMLEHLKQRVQQETVYANTYDRIYPLFYFLTRKIERHYNFLVKHRTCKPEGVQKIKKILDLLEYIRNNIKLSKKK